MKTIYEKLRGDTTISAVASMCAVSRNTIRNIESGEYSAHPGIVAVYLHLAEERRKYLQERLLCIQGQIEEVDECVRCLQRQ